MGLSFAAGRASQRRSQRSQTSTSELRLEGKSLRELPTAIERLTGGTDSGFGAGSGNRLRLPKCRTLRHPLERWFADDPSGRVSLPCESRIQTSVRSLRGTEPPDIGMWGATFTTSVFSNASSASKTIHDDGVPLRPNGSIPADWCGPVRVPDFQDARSDDQHRGGKALRRPARRSEAVEPRGAGQVPPSRNQG